MLAWIEQYPHVVGVDYTYNDSNVIKYIDWCDTNLTPGSYMEGWAKEEQFWKYKIRFKHSVDRLYFKMVFGI